MTEPLTTTDNALSADLLDGVGAFAAFTGLTKRRCFYLLARGHLPGGKIGNRWVGSKKAVRQHLDRITHGEAA